MAEGMLGGVLGDKDEKSETEAPGALAGVEAFAAAVAAIASRQDPAVARSTEQFLIDQSYLLKIQAAHLQDEHQLRLSQLRGQRIGLRLRIALQVFTICIATAIGAGIAVMLYDATTSRSVVVEAFDAPPSLVARGVTGTVVAGGLLDELTRLRDATRTSAVFAKRDLSGAWSNRARVSVPESGISLTELSSLLKARFGHDVHISGNLIETHEGRLALTVRGDEASAKTFAGTVDELDRITVLAAEYIYAESQPVLWAYYLENTSRYDEELAFIKAKFSSANPADRSYLLNCWGNALQDLGTSNREVLKMYEAAIKLKPDLWPTRSNIMLTLQALGDEEGAWRAGLDFQREAGGRPGAARERHYFVLDMLTGNLQAALSGEITDADASGGGGTGWLPSGIAIAWIQALLHDPDAAELALQTTRPDPSDPMVAAGTLYVRSLLATEAGDVTKAAAMMEAFSANLSGPALATNFANAKCWIARADEAAGHQDRADAILKTAGPFIDCYRFRADILDGRGDWPGAQKAYADAVALGPDLPAAYYSWGVALTKHGNFDGAAEKLKDANLKGPHWADPLKAWGDLLVKQGKIKDAHAKYDDALKYAPNWKELKEARETAAKQKS
jgi:tetratricopeptide (TPR) repeat protein